MRCCRCSARTSPNCWRRWTGCRSTSGCWTRRCTSSSRTAPNCRSRWPWPRPPATPATEVDADRKLLAAVERLHESNPMLGLRGVRLGLTTPGLFALQVRAITEAAIAQVQAGRHPKVEIMVPLVGSVMELYLVRDESDQLVEEPVRRGRGRAGRPDRHHDRAAAGRADRPSDRRGGRLLLLRHQRPDPDHLGILPGRRRVVGVRRLPGQGRLHRVAVRDHRRATASAGW